MIKDQDTESTANDLSEALQYNGVYVLMGEINTETVKPVIEWILYENYVVKSKKQELLLMICSEGGELQTAMALIDVMRTSSIPIKTVGLGQIASSGLLIFMCGTPGRRVLTPNTSILSHQFSWYNEGKAHELFATMREYELTQKRMIDLYRTTTGANDDVIREYLLPAQDRWLSAQEAKQYGICDIISDTVRPQPVDKISAKQTTRKSTK